jgi:hypothetical protein
MAVKFIILSLCLAINLIGIITKPASASSGYLERGCSTAVESSAGDIWDAEKKLIEFKKLHTMIHTGEFGLQFIRLGQDLRAYGTSCGVGKDNMLIAIETCKAVRNSNCIAVYQNGVYLIKQELAVSASASADELIDKITENCMTFGYTKGTEKFADCMKDLYLKETNSEQQSVQNNSASDAQLRVMRQQLELQRQQAAAAAEAEKRRQGFELMNQGLNTLNPSPPPSNRPLTCRTMSNGITTCQ